MTFARIALAPLVALAIAGPAIADDSGNFIMRLGQDTTSAEHFTRTAGQTVVEQVGRSPRVLQRHFVYDHANGELSHFSLSVKAPGATTPLQTIEARRDGDSLRIEIHTGSGPAQNLTVMLPRDALVVASSSPWSSYEGRIMQFLRSRSDSLGTTMYFLGAPQTDWLSFHRLGRDSVAIANGHMDRFHVRVDKAGHVLGVLPIAGTAKFSAERVPSLDVDAVAASFAAREKASGAMGVLSPRDTLNVANAGGASLWVDYGRPAKRGRVVFGEVVPYGEVWRTGANAATQFKTDKPLDFSGTVVPAGMYTLWTIPSASGWKLVFNGETGQWGTEHKPDRDLYTIDMKVGTLPAVVERFTISVDSNAQGGTLNLDWDTTRASVAFTVKS
jgi:hypothetical protein